MGSVNQVPLGIRIVLENLYYVPKILYAKDIGELEGVLVVGPGMLMPNEISIP